MWSYNSINIWLSLGWPKEWPKQSALLKTDFERFWDYRRWKRQQKKNLNIWLKSPQVHLLLLYHCDNTPTIFTPLSSSPSSHAHKEFFCKLLSWCFSFPFTPYTVWSGSCSCYSTEKVLAKVTAILVAKPKEHFQTLSQFDRLVASSC